MENPCKEKVTQFDAVIIGGGFKGMMTAYGLRKQGKRVCIIEKGKSLGGFMEPIHWQGYQIDKGPQYLDGVNQAQKAVLDDIMSEHEPLSELAFSYSSFWHGQTTKNFAIPDYRPLPKVEKSQLLFESLNERAASQQADCLADLYGKEMEVSYQYIDTWCKKFLQHSAQELSTLNANFVTFFGRKLLFNNEHSLYLKQFKPFDDTLAAQKATVNHGTYNLYPKGKHLGYFKDAFADKLAKLDVSVRLNCEVQRVYREASDLLIDLGEQVIQAKSVYFAGVVETAETLFLQHTSIEQYIKPVSQLFYLVRLEQPIELPFYTMNYSDSSIARVTYFNDYGEQNNDHPVICIEVPATTDSPIWANPESHFSQVKTELAEMGIDNVIDYQAFKVPSTYRALLTGYESKLAQMLNDIKNQYGENVHILTPHLLTRASIMQDLMDRGILKA